MEDVSLRRATYTIAQVRSRSSSTIPEILTTGPSSPRLMPSVFNGQCLTWTSHLTNSTWSIVLWIPSSDWLIWTRCVESKSSSIYQQAGTNTSASEAACLLCLSSCQGMARKFSVVLKEPSLWFMIWSRTAWLLKSGDVTLMKSTQSALPIASTLTSFSLAVTTAWSRYGIVGP